MEKCSSSGFVVKISLLIPKTATGMNILIQYSKALSISTSLPCSLTLLRKKKHFCRGLFVTSKHRCRTNLLFLSRENCSAISGNYALQTPLGLLHMPITPVVKFQFDLEAAGSATCNKKPFLFPSQQRLLLQPWVLPNQEDTEICKVPGEEQQKWAGSWWTSL